MLEDLDGDGLSEVLADPVAALDELGRVLGVKGRVLPMCPIALQIEADVAGLESDPRMSRVIRGQVAIATTVGKVRRVRLLPGDPPATRQAVDAIMSADLVVLGPGSWFTSVIPHVLVPQLAGEVDAVHPRHPDVGDDDVVAFVEFRFDVAESLGAFGQRGAHAVGLRCPRSTLASAGRPVVVTTLLLNFIVLLFVSAMLDGPMKDPAAMGWPQSVAVAPELELARLIEGTRVHSGLVLAVVPARRREARPRRKQLGPAELRPVVRHQQIETGQGARPGHRLPYRATAADGEHRRRGQQCDAVFHQRHHHGVAVDRQRRHPCGAGCGAGGGRGAGAVAARRNRSPAARS